MATRQECTVCRVTGGTVFLGTGAYMLYSARKSAPGSPRGKKFVMFVGAGMTTAPATVGVLQNPYPGFLLAGLNHLFSPTRPTVLVADNKVN
jgi:hypothetical protein